MLLTHLCNQLIVNEHLGAQTPPGTSREDRDADRQPVPQLARAGFGADSRAGAPSSLRPTTPGGVTIWRRHASCETCLRSPRSAFG
jgi:hypothetical protein